jgi:hypothetical protein
MMNIQPYNRLDKEKMQKFSVSSTNTWKACNRRYYYQQIQGWTLIDQPSWLAKGTAYDKMLELWDTVGYEETIKSIPELFPNPYEAVDAEYILRIYNEKFKDRPLRPVTFNNQQGNQLGFGFEVKGHDVTGPCVPFKATGYLDKLSSDEGELIVVERKTTSQSIEAGSEYWAQWALNPQPISYVAYLREMGARAGYVVVEAIRKPSTTVSPKAFDKKCSIQVYRERVMSHVEKKTLVARHKFYVSEDQSQEWLVDTINVVDDVRRAAERQKRIEDAGYEGLYAYPKSEKSCSDFGGCPHLDVCQGKTTHETSGKHCKSEKWVKANG